MLPSTKWYCIYYLCKWCVSSDQLHTWTPKPMPNSPQTNHSWYKPGFELGWFFDRSALFSTHFRSPNRYARGSRTAAISKWASTNKSNGKTSKTLSWVMCAICFGEILLNVLSFWYSSNGRGACGDDAMCFYVRLLFAFRILRAFVGCVVFLHISLLAQCSSCMCMERLDETEHRDD